VTPPTLPEEDAAAIRIAEGWLELGNPNEAGNAVEEVSFTNRNHPTVLLLRCRIYRSAKKPEPVFYLGQHLTRIMPDGPAGWFELAWAHTMLGRRPEAEAALTRCFELGGKDWKLVALEEAGLASLFAE
jgi:predicted Zn-dependent protease